AEYFEYSVVMRLAEQYLIRAEARAQQGNLAGPNGAESDLDMVRNRAGLDDVVGMGKNALLDAIMRERRVELFTEFGHRWLDLIRTGRADSVLATKPDWDAQDKLWPIPQRELDTNPNLTQNDGY